ncbi:uncharacterized protein METZ01_LOCUS102112, partial [marine metagenome]
MVSVRQLRRRIRSVENTSKVTNAMQLIAASKMRKAQVAALASRDYAVKIQEVIADLEAQPRDSDQSHPLLERREISRIEILHLTPDRGLCGGLHGNLNRSVGQFIVQSRPTSVSVIVAGRKGRDFMIRTGQDVKALFTGIDDQPTMADVLPMSNILLNDFVEGTVDEVYIAFPRFVSTVVQEPVIMRLLPVDPAELPTASRVGYIYEPGAREVLNSLLPRFVEMEVYHAFLELVASEHSARMVAMRNATDAANDLIDELTLAMNKVRQES